MVVIYKYPIRIGATVLELPGSNPKLLSVGYQGDQVFLWAEVNPQAATRTSVDIRAVGTGQVAPPSAFTFLQTLVDDVRTPYVWHFYYRLL